MYYLYLDGCLVGTTDDPEAAPEGFEVREESDYQPPQASDETGLPFGLLAYNTDATTTPSTKPTRTRRAT